MFLDLHVGVDDDRPPRPVTDGGRPLPPGYRVAPLVVNADLDEGGAEVAGGAAPVRVRVGAELWWARQHELANPLEADAACPLFGMPTTR